jgi:hypothetical protein
MVGSESPGRRDAEAHSTSSAVACRKSSLEHSVRTPSPTRPPPSPPATTASARMSFPLGRAHLVLRRGPDCDRVTALRQDQRGAGPAARQAPRAVSRERLTALRDNALPPCPRCRFSPTRDRRSHRTEMGAAPARSCPVPVAIDGGLPVTGCPVLHRLDDLFAGERVPWHRLAEHRSDAGLTTAGTGRATPRPAGASGASPIRRG